MKRYAIAAIAALTLVGPLAGTASAQQGSFGNDRRDIREDRRDAREDRRDDRRDAREDRRDQRQAQRWNQRSHNGYYMGSRFYYGQPSARVQARSDYRPAWQQWRRGDRLPTYSRSQYREVNWRTERLREPPRGYHYVRDDRGQVLLVGIATGVILSLLLSQ